MFLSLKQCRYPYQLKDALLLHYSLAPVPLHLTEAETYETLQQVGDKETRKNRKNINDN